MRVVSIDDRDAIRCVVDVLRNAGVVALPTDTLYGFSVPLASELAYKRLVRAKGYDNDHRFLCLAASIDMVERFVDAWGCTTRRELASAWPAPLTAILPAAKNFPRWAGDTIACRVPDHDWLRNVIADFGEPILSTSINRKGEPPLYEAESVEASFADEIDLLVIGAAAGRSASTVVDFTGVAPVVVRPGAFSWPSDSNPSN